MIRAFFKGFLIVSLLVMAGLVALFFLKPDSVEIDPSKLSGLIDSIDLPSPKGSDRNWTDQNGRELTGALIASTREEVMIRVSPSQKVFRIPLSRLSSEDQEYALKKAEDSDEYAETYPPVPNRWPSRVEGRTQPLNLRKLPDSNRWTTTHYEFRPTGELDETMAGQLAITCEAVDVALRNSPLPLLWGRDPDIKRAIIIYTTDEAFYATGAPANAGAYYLPLTNEVHVPLSQLNENAVNHLPSQFSLKKRSSYKIMVHELVHQASVSYIFMGIPAWVSEGTAEFYSAMQVTPGEFNFQNHQVKIRRYLSERILPGGEIQFAGLPLPRLEQFLFLDTPEFNEMTSRSPAAGTLEYAAALLLTEYFIHAEENSLRSYLEAVFTGVPADDALEKFIIRGRDSQEIERLLKQRWISMGIRLRFSEKPMIKPSDLQGDVGIGL